MLLELAREHDLALAESYMIGDTWKDAVAAQAAGCKSIMLDRPYNRDDPADRRVANLGEAVELGHYASVGTAIKYLEQRCQSDPNLARFMDRAKERLFDISNNK